jgi:hypothetical protein
MQSNSDSTRAAAARTSKASTLALLSFVVFLLAPGAFRLVIFAVMAAGAVWVVACAGLAIRDPGGSPRLHWVAAASAVGMVGSVLYLLSLSTGRPGVPLLGVLLLLGSINGLFVASLLLRRRSIDPGAGR